MGVSAAAPAAVVAPEMAGVAAAAAVQAAGENYRLTSKIFEKLPADTAVDIMNNLTDEEKVKILAAMKETTVADILAAFDPGKSAELTRMLAQAK